MNDAAKEILIRGAAQIGLHLSDSDLGRLHIFADELKKWGKKINLTAIREDADITVKHFLDSLTLLKVVKGKGRLLDIGSGGGFPAIPMKIALHDLHVLSVDAVEKKIIFQRHAARLLHLHDFEAVHARGEELAAKYSGHFDWVVSRAFSDIPTFVKIVEPLIKPSGKILAMKGKGGRDEARAAEFPISEMGIEVKEILEFQLPVTGDARCIIVMERKKQ